MAATELYEMAKARLFKREGVDSPLVVYLVASVSLSLRRAQTES